MEEKSLNEKRASARDDYCQGKIDIRNEQELLKYFLLLSSKNENADELSKRLMSRFASIKNIISSDILELISVEGCNDSLAVLLTSMGSIINRILEHKNDGVTHLNTTEEQKRYFKNLLFQRQEERLIVITLDNDMKIINSHSIASGGAGFVGTTPTDITRIVLHDKPSKMLLGHNHPNGSAKASNGDINFTISFCSWVEELGVKLVDHIIVGDNTVSTMKEQGFERYLSNVNS